jgi:hypothetical protein
LRREFYTPAFNSGDRIDTAPDRKKAVAEALDHFEKLLGKLKAGDDPRVRRNVEFRIASLLARQAREEGKPPGPAIRKLREFCKNRVDGWQIIPSARLLGRLLTTEKQYRQAEQVYGDLAANPLLPVEARNTCRLLAARVSIRPGKYPEAMVKLQALADKLPKDSRQIQQARIGQAECLAALGKLPEARDKLNMVLDEAKNDKELRAQAYNTLGQCSYAAKQYKDALWDFLRVDVVYYQDREEHAKALYYLTDLFGKLKDEPRAKDCRARLKGREFSGTEYQTRLLKKEK